MKKKKFLYKSIIYCVVFIILSYSFVFILLNIFPESSTFIKSLVIKKNYHDNEKLEFINYNKEIIQIEFNNNDKLLVLGLNSEETLILEELDLYKREFKTIRKFEKETILHKENNRVLICQFENFEITSPDQTATKIVIEDLLTNENTTVSSKETIKPITCGLKQFYAETSMPILEKEYFEIKKANESYKTIKLEKSPHTKIKQEMMSVWNSIIEKKQFKKYSNLQPIGFSSNDNNDEKAFFTNDNLIIIYRIH